MKPFVCAVAMLALLSFPALAEDGAKAMGKDLLAKKSDAVISIRLVTTTRYNYGGQQTHKQENKTEVTGTVLDPSGLTVTSNFSTDPTGAFSGFSFESGGERMQIKPETTIGDCKLVLGDGTEIEAEFVLRDADLDLAFLRPKEKQEKPFACIEFAKPSAAPGILDEVITVGRLSRAVNRANSVGLGTVNAIVNKPRTFYVIDAVSGYTSMGCPVFTAKGETLGLLVMRKSPVENSGMMGGLFGGMQPVVLPAEDLGEIVVQAKAAKGANGEKKDGEAKPEAPAQTE